VPFDGEFGHLPTGFAIRRAPLLALYCLLLTAYCLLLTAYCLLLTAYCLLPAAWIEETQAIRRQQQAARDRVITKKLGDRPS
jgi:hypothetical protein